MRVAEKIEVLRDLLDQNDCSKTVVALVEVIQDEKNLEGLRVKLRELVNDCRNLDTAQSSMVRYVTELVMGVVGEER